MELVHILRTLWKKRAWLALAAVVAVVAAIAVGYRITPSIPPQLETRELGIGAASTQVLIDSPRSAQTDLRQDPADLAQRAMVYAQALAGAPAVADVSKATGFPARQIQAAGPFDGEGNRSNFEARPSEERANELLSEGKGYRINYDAQAEYPLITFNAQAPTAAEAERLAAGGVTALRAYVERLENADVPVNKRVVVRVLGEPEGGTVDGGVSPMLMGLTFIGVFGGGCLLIILLSGFAREWKRVAAEEQALEMERYQKPEPRVPEEAEGWPPFRLVLPPGVAPPAAAEEVAPPAAEQDDEQEPDAEQRALPAPAGENGGEPASAAQAAT